MDLGEVTYENLLNSPSRGNLVDGLPRAASGAACVTDKPLNLI